MVESSRRDFLKMFGIGAAVVAAPNVFVSPQLEATMTYVPEVTVAETIDPMKLYYHLGIKSTVLVDDVCYLYQYRTLKGLKLLGTQDLLPVE